LKLFYAMEIRTSKQTQIILGFNPARLLIRKHRSWIAGMRNCQEAQAKTEEQH
jgi:hypothetical protein